MPRVETKTLDPLIYYGVFLRLSLGLQIIPDYGMNDCMVDEFAVGLLFLLGLQGNTTIRRNGLFGSLG